MVEKSKEHKEEPLTKVDKQLYPEEVLEEGTGGATGGAGAGGAGGAGDGTVLEPGAFAVYPTNVTPGDGPHDVDEIYDADYPPPDESPDGDELVTDIHIYDEAEHRDLVKRKVVERIQSRAVEASTVHAIGSGGNSNSESNGSGTVKGKGSTEEQYNSRKTIFLVLMLGCGLVCIAITLAVGFTYEPSSSSTLISVDDEEDPVDENPVASVVPVPSPATTNAPTMSTIGMLRDIVMPLSDEDTLYDSTSPQYQALEWLAMEDDITKTFMETIMMATASMNDENAQDATTTTTTTIRLLQERYAAATLYYSLDGLNWSVDLEFLTTNETICNWPNLQTTDIKEGIQCDDSGFVKSVIFDGVGTNGTIPKEISAMSSLQIFQVSTAYDIYGTLPSEMDRLTRMKRIYILHSQLSGTIPNTYSKMTNLEDFVLAYSSLSGTIPHDLLQITSLEWFQVVGSEVTGTIPNIDHPETLTKLSRLQLENNQMTGTVPLNIYSLTKLRRLRVYNNYITGALPSEIGQLTDMENLDYYNCDLTGTIPTEIGNLINMVWFSVDNNDCTGQLPSEMGLLQRAEWLVLQNNNFSGMIPTELGKLDRLTNIILLGNQHLTGVMPTEFLELPALSYINIGNTSMARNAFEAYCNQSAVSVTLRADCAGENPKVDCPCCAGCFDYETDSWILDNAIVCEIEVNALDRDIEGRNTTCDCSSTTISGTVIVGETSTNATTTVDIDVDEDGSLFVHPDFGTLHHKVCSDNCQSCNRDGTICAKNVGFGFGFNERKAFDERADVHHTAWSTYRYTLGRNDTIDFETYLAENADGLIEVDRVCNVYVNGQKCRACERHFCADNWYPIRAWCDNIDGVGNVDACDGISEDGGPLTIFDWQDEIAVEGCTPVFPELSFV